MKCILFDASGEIITRYDSDIHGDSIPTEAVEVSEEVFSKTINETDGVWKLDQATGKVSKHPFPPPTQEQVEAQKVAVVQNHMDEAARALRYDSIASAITYAEEPAVPKFQAEGQAFRAWRSEVWAACYAILDAVKAGERSVPTDSELIAELPALQLPA